MGPAVPAAPSLATPLLAGSALTLPRAIANTVRWTGLPLDDVIPMASTIPAAYLGTTTAGTVLADWDAGVGRSPHPERSIRMNIATLDWIVLVGLPGGDHRDRPRSPDITSARAAIIFSAAGDSDRG